jgi:hypothetical protein
MTVEARTDDVWDNLPPHLQEGLREAFTGLSEAFGDSTAPLGPQLRKLWDIADEIEAYVLACEEEREDV